MPTQIEAAWLNRFAAKIGIAAPRAEDRDLIDGLLDLMQQDQADFTNTFDALARGDARDQFLNREALDDWHTTWQARIASEAAPNDVMRAANPRIIPRNHRIEEMIAAAVAGDYAPFHRLNTELSRPFDSEDAELRRPPTKDEVVPATFCGT
jgi:uncharacterized protein YdiU (UPF0061 family)